MASTKNTPDTDSPTAQPEPKVYLVRLWPQPRNRTIEDDRPKLLVMKHGEFQFERGENRNKPLVYLTTDRSIASDLRKYSAVDHIPKGPPAFQVFEGSPEQAVEALLESDAGLDEPPKYDKDAPGSPWTPIPLGAA
jgi:hypothetical protein